MRMLSASVAVGKKCCLIVVCFLFVIQAAYSQFNISQIVISGNEKVSDETIRAISGLSPKSNTSSDEINQGFKRLTKSGLFQNVTIDPVGSRLVISVIENPFLEKVVFEGNKIFKDDFLEGIVKSKNRSAFNSGTIDEDVRVLLQLYRHY